MDSWLAWFRISSLRAGGAATASQFRGPRKNYGFDDSRHLASVRFRFEGSGSKGTV